MVRVSVPWIRASTGNLPMPDDDAQPAFGDFADLVVSAFHLEGGALVMG